jgi:hypothetical protein
MKQKQRLMWALSGYVVIAIVAYFTLPDKITVWNSRPVPMSVPVILLMALLAFKSILHRNATLHDDEGSVESGSEGRE